MSNNETIGVKLSFDGQMRRFPLARGTTYASLNDQIIALLELEKNADIVLKYTDEEGDLITISSDLELNSSLVPGQLLRIVVTERKNATAPKQVPVTAPAVNPSHPAPASVVAPQGPEVFKAFAHGCGRGGFRGGHGHGARGGHFRRDLSPEDWEKLKEERRKASGLSDEEWKKLKEERKKAHGARGAFGGHGAHGGHFRRDLSPEDWAKFKEERRKASGLSHEEWEKLKEERKKAREQMREARGFPPGFGGRGGRWAGRCGGNATAPNGERLVARFAKDVTIEDGSQLVPGTPFVKTWRLRNEGQTEWPAGSVLRFLGKHSDSLGGPETVPLSVAGPVAPNTEVDISVNLVAPEKPGRYSGYWRMCTADGRKFGQRVWVSIVVPANSSSSSSEEDKEADKYEALVDAVLAKGVTAKRHRIFRLLNKFDGDVDLVCQRLAAKAQRRDACKGRRAAAAAANPNVNH